ncbi:MAG TPA: PH domain-containing protein [Burkholderiales bacterium]|jgi:uncharacterized membrane protein YdbT with pleckstrin-like domain|nr:PH domain-containing protein [Burkholderiales bacterium]
MSYIEDSLSAEEKVVAVFRQHWVTRLWLMLWILLLITIPIAIYEWLRLRTIEHGVTNKRVIYKHGIISRNTEEMKLGSIETVRIDQGVWGRILGFGDIRVTGKGISDVVFRRMDDPMEVKRRIEGVSHPVA